MQNEERADILSTTADSVVEGELVDEGMAEAIARRRPRTRRFQVGLYQQAAADEPELSDPVVPSPSFAPMRECRIQPARFVADGTIYETAAMLGSARRAQVQSIPI